MTFKSNFLKSYLPTIILLATIALFMGITYLSGNWVQKNLPQITPFNAILLVLVGFAAGLLGGLIGTGGCSVILPILHFWLGYPPPFAVGTTLFAVIFTTLSGAYGHLIRRNLDKSAALWIGGLGTLGVLVGSWLFTLLLEHAKVLNLILGVVFLWPSYRMIVEGSGIFKPKGGGGEGGVIPGSRVGMGLFGFVVGILTGIVGLGGGYALVPGLIYLFGAPVYVTMGTSLASMIPLTIVGGVIKALQGYVALGAGLILATGIVIGAQVGAAVMKRFKPNILKLIFGIYFLYVALKFITGYFGIMIW